MILVDKGTVDTEGKVDEIGAELASAIVGVFDAFNNHLDEFIALAMVQAAIKTATDKIEKDYGVTLFEGSERDSVINIQVIKVPQDGTNISDILKEAEHYRKAEQGADANAKPTE